MQTRGCQQLIQFLYPLLVPRTHLATDDLARLTLIEGTYHPAATRPYATLFVSPELTRSAALVQLRANDWSFETLRLLVD